MALAVRKRRASGARPAQGSRGSRAEIVIFDDADALLDGAAETIAALIVDAVARRGRCAIALSGGSTPRGLYERLARRTAARRAPRIPWRSVSVFWSDERAVPPGDPQSNFRMANESLLSRVPIPARAIHRVYGEIGAAHAAVVYDATIRGTLGSLGAARARGTPRIDLVLLGVGADGHTASLFPGRAFDPLDPRVVAPSVAPSPPRDRVTLTLRAINAARAVVFLASGGEKANVVAAAVGAARASLPASCVAPRSGRLVWLLDRAAAARLSGGR